MTVVLPKWLSYIIPHAFTSRKSCHFNKLPAVELSLNSLPKLRIHSHASLTSLTIGNCNLFLHIRLLELKSEIDFHAVMLFLKHGNHAFHHY